MILRGTPLCLLLFPNLAFGRDVQFAHSLNLTPVPKPPALGLRLSLLQQFYNMVQHHFSHLRFAEQWQRLANARWCE